MTGRRDCQHRRTQHQHGTRAAYTQDRCRCFPCRLASSRANLTQQYGDGLLVDSAGTVRRIRALACLGWSCQAVAEASGLRHLNAIHRLRERPPAHVMKLTADAVAEAYELLSMRYPPTAEPNQRRGVLRVQSLAKSRKWAPPLAWDDDTIDDPAATPMGRVRGPRTVIDPVAVTEVLAGRPVHLTRAETLEAVRVATARGMSSERIAERLRNTSRTVQRARAVAA